MESAVHHGASRYCASAAADALLVVVALAVEPEQGLRDGESRAWRPRVDELVVRLEEVVALAGVGDGVEAPVAVGVAGDLALEVGARHAEVGEVRLLGAAVEVQAERLAAERAPRGERVGPELRPGPLAVALGLDAGVAPVEVPAARQPSGVGLEHRSAWSPTSRRPRWPRRAAPRRTARSRPRPCRRARRRRRAPSPRRAAAAPRWSRPSGRGGRSSRPRATPGR